MRAAAGLAIAALTIAACAGNQAAPGPGAGAAPTAGTRQAVSRGDALLILAAADLQRRNYGNAIAAATAALQSGSLTPRRTALAYEVRGTAHLELRDGQRARDDYNAGIAADPGYSGLYLTRAYLNIAERHLPQARADLDRSIELRPHFVAHYVRGLLRLATNDRRGARDDFDRVVALQPTAHEGYYGRGLIHHLAGQVGQARQDYQKALELRPGFVPAQRALEALNARRPAPMTPPARPDAVIPL
jgi:tetratricopeptide (TPR) repeat protein